MSNWCQCSQTSLNIDFRFDSWSEVKFRSVPQLYGTFSFLNHVCFRSKHGSVILWVNSSSWDVTTILFLYHFLSFFIQSSCWSCQNTCSHDSESRVSCSQHVTSQHASSACTSCHNTDTGSVLVTHFTRCHRGKILLTASNWHDPTFSRSLTGLHGKDFFWAGVEWEKQAWLIFAKHRWPSAK